jgi:putative ATP-dependent endonuclease of OLD family
LLHRISTLTVHNFKAIRYGTFHFSDYTPLVGYNNAGKSSVLEALTWVIKPSSIPETSFNNSAEEVSVAVEVTGITDAVLDGLADNHRNKIIAFIDGGRLSFRRTQTAPGQSASQIRLEIIDINEGNDWVAPPTGIPAALSALFPEVIFVGAMENAADDVGKSTSSSTTGKLIKQIVEPVREQYSAQILASLTPIADQLSARGVNKDQILRDVDETIERYLAEFFPGMSAKTHIPMPEIDDFLKKATIKVSENRYGDDLEGDAATMGHGAQRSVQIALINALAHIRRNDGGVAGRTVLLLLDEPELYLHPQAIAVVRSALKKLSGNGFQIAFTTHTGEMIGAEDCTKTLIIRRTPENGCNALTKMEDAAGAIADLPNQADTLFELSNSKEFLFSDRVILVEGRTETTILPHLYQKIRGRSLLEDRVGIIRLNGSGSLKKAYDVLIAMGLDARIVADLDYIFKIAFNNGILGVTDERSAEIRSIFQRLADDGQLELSNDGLPKNSNLCTASEGFELLAADAEAIPIIATLVEDLKQQHIWIWTKGAIEAHIGIEKNFTAQRQFVESLAAGNALDGIPDLGAVHAAMNFVFAET